MPTLTYSGRLSISTTDDGTIPTTEADALHQLLDDAIAAYEGDRVCLETAVVHFERSDDTVANDMPRAHVKISADGPINELSTVEGALAEEVVAIGLEDDEASAKEVIQIE